MRLAKRIPSPMFAVAFSLVIGIVCTATYRSNDSLRQHGVFLYQPFVSFLQLIGGLAIATIVVAIFALKGWLPRSLVPFISFVLIGAALFGGSAIIGTDLLGHMRPMGMEFDSAFGFAQKGVVVGALTGVVIALLTRHQPPTPSTRSD